MKQHRAASEDHQRPIARKLPQRACRLIGMAYRLAAMRLLRIDLLGTNAAERKDRWGAQGDGDEEDCPIRDQISAGAHPDGGNTGADRCKARVAAKPFSDGGMTH